MIFKIDRKEKANFEKSCAHYSLDVKDASGTKALNPFGNTTTGTGTKILL